MYLRHTYVSVLVFSDGSVLDMHKHWFQGAGQSEHSWFVKSLEDTRGYHEALLPHQRGPLNSQPSTGPHIKPKPKRSDHLKRMLEAPEEESVPIRDAAASAHSHSQVRPPATKPSASSLARPPAEIARCATRRCWGDRLHHVLGADMGRWSWSTMWNTMQARH